MGPDRTQHIIDSIDGALADDEFPDAMRWSPQPDTVDDAPAPFDGTLVWQPPQRYEGRGFGAGSRRAAERRALHHALDVDAAVFAAPARTRPPTAGEWTDVGYLVNDGLTFGFDGSRSGDDVAVAFQPWPAAVLAATFGAAFREVAEAMSRLFATSSDEIMRMVAELGEALMPPAREESAGEEPREEDPRARALRLRQQRNTGPSRDVVRQRRPRRLP